MRSGARTVKSVQGYDLHRLATGSLGTLGAIALIHLLQVPDAFGEIGYLGALFIAVTLFLPHGLIGLARRRKP